MQLTVLIITDLQVPPTTWIYRAACDATRRPVRSCRRAAAGDHRAGRLPRVENGGYGVGVDVLWTCFPYESAGLDDNHRRIYERDPVPFNGGRTAFRMPLRFGYRRVTAAPFLHVALPRRVHQLYLSLGSTYRAPSGLFRWFHTSPFPLPATFPFGLGS